MLVFDDRNYYRINLKRSVQLAVIAKIKRFFSPKIRKPKNKYIHIGCGFHRFEEFDNLDFYNSSFSFWKKKNYIPHDFKYKLPYEDNSFEGAFSGHTLEHLYFDESKFLLKEICRVLKPNGINIYTGRHTQDGDYKNGVHIGEDLYENDGFIVHFFSKEKIKDLSKGFNIIEIEKFEEGSFPRKLFKVILKKKSLAR